MQSVARSADVIVIGAGVIGLSTALELLGAGLRVTVIERGAVGRGGASWAGGGILSPVEPADVHADVLPILRDSLAVYPDWCGELHQRSGVDPEYLVSGMNVYAPADLARWRGFAQHCGMAIHDMPACSSRSLQPVLSLPGVAQVRSPRLLRALAASVRSRGGRIIEGESVRQLVGWLRVTGVRTARATHSAGAVVLAAGAWSNTLCARAKVRPVRGEMLLLQGQIGELRHILVGRGRYLIPRADGNILAGSTVDHTGFEDAPSMDGRARIQRSVRELAPWLSERPVLAHWSGLRPAPIGAAPLIGWVPWKRGLLLNCGHYRLGITLAPGSARYASQLIMAATSAQA